MTRKRKATRRLKKRAYRPPVLRTYGDLRTLTGAKGGSKGDGAGVPKTRTTASP